MVRFAIWLTLCLAAPALAQTAEEFSISGTVTNALTSEPVRRALVKLFGGTLPGTKSTLTDAAGTFRFTGLTAGQYRTSVEKPGFDAERRMGPESVIAVGPSRDNIVLRLLPEPAITGRVVDGNGEPADGVVVEALRSTVMEGRRQVRMQGSGVTDDRGEYRIAHLRPGAYFLRAASRRGGMLGYLGESAPRLQAREGFAPVYYPNAAVLSGAVSLALKAGQDAHADFTLIMQRAYRVRGELVNYRAYEQPRLEVLRGDDDVAAGRFTLNAANGRFEIQDLVPGQYTLRATMGEGRDRLRGERTVTVSGADVNNAAIELLPGVDVHGRVTVAGEFDSKLNARCHVSLRSASWLEPETFSALSTTDGRLDIYGVLPDRYRMQVMCGMGYVSALRWGDKELAPGEIVTIVPAAPPPLEITVRTDAGTVTGKCEGSGATAVSIVLSGENSTIVSRTVTAGAEFTIDSLRPGRYRAYCFPGAEDIEYAEPGALERAGVEGQEVRVGERDRVSVALKSGGSR